MLSQCANSQCGRPFLRLGEGKLFLVETECVAGTEEKTARPSARMRQIQQQVERYWLCDQCAQVWTMVYDLGQGIVLLPLPAPTVGTRVAMTAEY